MRWRFPNIEPYGLTAGNGILGNWPSSRWSWKTSNILTLILCNKPMVTKNVAILWLDTFSTSIYSGLICYGSHVSFDFKPLLNFKGIILVKGNHISGTQCLGLLGEMKTTANDKLCFVAKFKLPDLVYKKNDCPVLKQVVYLLGKWLKLGDKTNEWNCWLDLRNDRILFFLIKFYQVVLSCLSWQCVGEAHRTLKHTCMWPWVVNDPLSGDQNFYTNFFMCMHKLDFETYTYSWYISIKVWIYILLLLLYVSISGKELRTTFIEFQQCWFSNQVVINLKELLIILILNGVWF